jgi:hypothetical protein
MRTKDGLQSEAQQEQNEIADTQDGIAVHFVSLSCRRAPCPGCD